MKTEWNEVMILVDKRGWRTVFGTMVVGVEDDAVSSLIQETFQRRREGSIYPQTLGGNKALGPKTIREYYAMVCLIWRSVDGNCAPLSYY